MTEWVILFWSTSASKGMLLQQMCIFFFLHIWIFHSPFPLKLEAERVSDCYVVSLAVSCLFLICFFMCVVLALFVSLWPLLKKQRQRNYKLHSESSASLSWHPHSSSYSPLPDECMFYTELMGRLLVLHWISFNRFIVALEGSAASVIQDSLSQKILVVQEFRVLARLPKSVEAEVEIHFNHLFALIRKSEEKSESHLGSNTVSNNVT